MKGQQRKRKKRNKKSRTWLSATLYLLFHACLLALSHSGRHERITACTLLLCAGPIEGCSAVLAVRRYYGFRSLVCASWCSEKEKQVQKEKLRCLMFLGGHIIASRGDDTANNCIVSKKSTSPAVMAPRGWYSPMPWLALRRAPVSRTCHTYTNTHVRASCCLLLLWCCCCIAVGSGAATTTAAYSLVLSPHQL